MKKWCWRQLCTSKSSKRKYDPGSDGWGSAEYLCGCLQLKSEVGLKLQKVENPPDLSCVCVFFTGSQWARWSLPSVWRRCSVWPERRRRGTWRWWRSSSETNTASPPSGWVDAHLTPSDFSKKLLLLFSLKRFSVSESGCLSLLRNYKCVDVFQAQLGVQGDGGRRKGGDKRRCQRNKTVSLFIIS